MKNRNYRILEHWKILIMTLFRIMYANPERKTFVDARKTLFFGKQLTTKKYLIYHDFIDRYVYKVKSLIRKVRYQGLRSLKNVSLY